MRDELEYVDEPVNPEQEPYRSSYHGKRRLYEWSVMRLYADGRRVVVPSGFGGGATTPKGARPLCRVEVDASDEEGLRDLFSVLEGIELRNRKVNVEHEVDGAKASYRVVRISGGGGGHGLTAPRTASLSMVAEMDSAHADRRLASTLRLR